jgi:hypothetical protein
MIFQARYLTAQARSGENIGCLLKSPTKCGLAPGFSMKAVKKGLRQGARLYFVTEDYPVFYLKILAYNPIKVDPCPFPPIPNNMLQK